MTFLERYQHETKGFAIHAVGEGESFFSWSPCDTCGCSLGGERYPCTLVSKPGDAASEQIEVESCVDCVQFAANGTLPEEDAG